MASVEDVRLLKQGAEAKIYACTFFGRSTIIKERFSKHYRHPALDESLTVQRTKSEVRCMLRCRTHGIRTPAVYYVDLQASKIYMENIDSSQTVKDYILSIDATSASSEDVLMKLANTIGTILGSMHQKNIIHGDLTTSNLLIIGVPSITDLQLCLIDFGLGSLEGTAEDKAVDLYVLERALLSTHPETLRLFDAIISNYVTAYAGKPGTGSAEVIRKLEEVRQRGRKRTMVG